jgi:hypothetical protein
MIQPNRIACGLADSLLTDANPKRLIEAAFRRGVPLGVAIGAASRGCPTRFLLYDKEARYGPC